MAIELCETRSNNHGCHGTSVWVVPTGTRTGIVERVVTCNSCPGTGCDGETRFTVGQRVSLPEWFTGGWEKAQKLVGFSHNELVDRPDMEPDTTAVRPADLA